MFKKRLLCTPRPLSFLILAVLAFSNPKRTPHWHWCNSYHLVSLLMFLDVFSGSMAFHGCLLHASLDAYQDSVGIYRFLVIPSYPRLSRSLQNRQAYCSRHGYGLVMALGFQRMELLGIWMEYDGICGIWMEIYGNGGVRKLGQVTEEQRTKDGEK